MRSGRRAFRRIDSKGVVACRLTPRHCQMASGRNRKGPDGTGPMLSKYGFGYFLPHACANRPANRHNARTGIRGCERTRQPMGAAPYLVIVASVVVVRWIAKTSTAPLEPARSQPLISVPPCRHAFCARRTPCPHAGRRGIYTLPRMPPRPSSRPPAMSPMPARTPSPASPATAPAASAVCGMLGSRGSSGFFASSTLGLASTS